MMRTPQNESSDEAKQKRRARLEREYERRETSYDSLEEPPGWLYVLEQAIIFSGALAFLVGSWYVISIIVLKFLHKGGGTQ